MFGEYTLCRCLHLFQVDSLSLHLDVLNTLIALSLLIQQEKRTFVSPLQGFSVCTVLKDTLAGRKKLVAAGVDPGPPPEGQAF